MKTSILALVALICLITPCLANARENPPGYYTYSAGDIRPDASLSALTPQWVILGDLAVLCQSNQLKSEQTRKSMLDRLCVGTWQVVEANITIRDGKSTATLIVARATEKPFDPSVAVINNMILSSEGLAELASTMATITFTHEKNLRVEITRGKEFLYSPQTITKEEDLSQFLKK